MIVRGKKIYRTALLWPFRLTMFVLAFSFYRDTYLSTFQDPKFIETGSYAIWDAIQFHYKYPVEVVTLSFLVLTPIIYYGFIRGTRFFEKGYLFNKGLPFVNTWVPYEEIKQYKLLVPKSILAIFTKSGEIHVVSDGNIERVLALLDQHNVPGDLAQDAYVHLIQNIFKFFVIVLSFTLLIFIINKFGWLKIIL